MAKIIDLTLTLKEGMRGVSFETARQLKKDGWNALTLHLYSHAGTHMDAPYHFGVNNQTIDQISLNNCMGKAWLVDATDIRAKEEIRLNHIGVIKNKFKLGDSLLIRTGWSNFYEKSIYRDELPPISEELACWCIQAGVKMLGVEPPSVANVHNMEQLTKIHQILLGAGITIVEGLANLDQIKQTSCQFYAIPLKIHNGDGAPCRAFAIEN